MLSMPIYMLNLDIGKSLTGIESSAFARATMMQQQLGTAPFMVTSRFNLDLHANLAQHQASGKAPAHLTVINLYDYFQQASHYVGDLTNGYAFQLSDGFTAAPVAGNADLRLYQQGTQIGYVARHIHNQAVKFINYIHNEKIWRREWYDARGFLSKIDFIDLKHGNADSRYEHYLRPDGTLAMARQYQFDDDKKRSHQVTQVFNAQGQLTHQFNSEAEMLAAMLTQLASVGAVFIIDRIKEYYAAAKQAKLSYPATQLLPIYHSTHFVNWTDKPGDPFSSGINAFHLASLEDFSFPDAHIVFTEQQRDHMATRFGAGNLVVIPHSHPDIRVTNWSARQRKHLVMLGRFAEEKQQWLAVEAFAQVVKKHKDATLAIYGYGEKEKQIKDAISKHKLEKSVSIQPFSHDVQTIYRHAGAMLMTSRNEGFGLVVMESLFNGCPVVAFNCNYGPGAMIQEGVNGKLVPVQNVDALAKAIIELFDHPKQHQAMVEQASESMQAFTHESVAHRWQALLSSGHS